MVVKEITKDKYTYKYNLLFEDGVYKTNMMKFDDIIDLLNRQYNIILNKDIHICELEVFLKESTHNLNSKIKEQEKTITNLEQSIKILKQEIDDTQAVLEMLSEKLKGWN